MQHFHFFKAARKLAACQRAQPPHARDQTSPTPSRARASRCAYASRRTVRQPPRACIRQPPRTMPRPRRRALVLLLATTNALVIRLEAGARECFLLDVSKEAAVSGNFELISEGVTPEPLGVVVSGAAGADPLYETHGQPDGTFAFDVADDGVVDLCLSNGDASNNDGRARTVGFAIRASVHHPSTDGEGSMDALLDVSEELNEGLLTLTDHQAYMRRREEHHAAVLESTRARVLWWTVAETAVLIALSLWQILTVRAFFETKRRL